MRPTEPAAGAPAGAAGADRAVSGAGAQLDYLSRVSVSLGLPDPVQEYYGPVVGRWHDLHDEAVRWRHAASTLEELADGVTSPLGQLDAAWHGSVSDSFLDHMRQIGKAGTSTSDAMAAMAEVLDRTAEAMHRLVTDTVDMLAAGADRVSLAMLLPVEGEARAGSHIAELGRHGRRMLEAVHELLEAFAEACQSLDEQQPFAEVAVATPFPEQGWSFRPELAMPPAAGQAVDPAAGQPVDPATAQAVAGGLDGGAGAGAATAGAAALAGGGSGGAGGLGGGLDQPAGPPEPAMRTFAAEPSAAGTAQAAGSAGSVAGSGGQRAATGMGMPFLPMGAGMAGHGGDTERRSKSGLSADPVEIFGKPSKTAPPVIGDD